MKASEIEPNTLLLMVSLSTDLDSKLSLVPLPEIVDEADELIGISDIDSDHTITLMNEWIRDKVAMLLEPDEEFPEPSIIDILLLDWYIIAEWLRVTVKMKRIAFDLYTEMQRDVAEGFIPPFTRK